MWLWENASTAFPCSAILTGNPRTLTLGQMLSGTTLAQIVTFTKVKHNYCVEHFGQGGIDKRM